MNQQDQQNQQDLRKRTKDFALRVIHLYGALPQKNEAQIIGKQLLRSGTSVGANYREAYRARSQAEFISKIGICLQELEETLYWFELLIEAKIIEPKKLNSLQKEGNELVAIFVSSINTAKKKLKRK